MVRVALISSQQTHRGGPTLPNCSRDLEIFLAPGCEGAFEDPFLSLSYQGVEKLAELWLDNLYVYQVIITPEIGNCLLTTLMMQGFCNAVSLQIY